MTKINEKIEDVSSSIGKMETELQTRINSLKGLLGTLQSDIGQANETQRTADGKITTTENEIKLHEANIASEKSSIASLESTLQQLKPDYETKTNLFSELETTISDLETKQVTISSDITNSSTRQTQLETEKAEKAQAFSDLEGSIDKDLETNKAALEEVKAQFAKLLDTNIVWDYMFEILETPEIEIMAIIAANRGISLDEIKQKATSVSPVFVGRAISKLEADGKIVDNNDLWDISPSLLELISN